MMATYLDSGFEWKSPEQRKSEKIRKKKELTFAKLRAKRKSKRKSKR